MNDEQIQRLGDLERRHKDAVAAGDREAIEQILEEGRNMVVEAGGVDMASLQGVADLMESAVNVALLVLVLTAHELGVQHVPVQVLVALQSAPKTAVRAFWGEATRLDGMIKVDVPDDISSLEV